MGGATARAEETLARGMAYVRCAMVAFEVLPLLDAGRLRYPSIAVIAALAAGVEAGWVFWRVRRTRTLRDSLLVRVDAGFCIALIAAGAVASGPGLLYETLPEVLPYTLAAAGFAGIGAGLSGEGAILVGALAVAWTAAALPGRDVRLASDLLGFGAWYAVTIAIAREFRRMAAVTAQAQAEAERNRERIAEQARQADVAREREITHREIHDHLLPIVDAIAEGRAASDGLTRLAAREAARARRLLMDGRLTAAPGFAALIADVRDTYVDAGLPVTAVLRIVADPPPAVCDAVAGAAREALSNVLKHARSDGEVNLYVESTESGVELVVRDHGVGFDPGSVVPGGGFRQAYEAVRRRGGAVEVVSHPGGGTKVTVRWRASR